MDTVYAVQWKGIDSTEWHTVELFSTHKAASAFRSTMPEDAGVTWRTHPVPVHYSATAARLAMAA